MDIKRFLEITKDSLFSDDGAQITKEEKDNYDETMKSICLVSGIAFGTTLSYLYLNNREQKRYLNLKK